MKQFTVYDDSGRILRSGTCQDEMLQAQAIASGEHVLEGFGAWATQYVSDGALLPRSPSTVTLAQSGSTVTLSNVRSGTLPNVLGATGEVFPRSTFDGSTVSFTLASGTYLVSVDSFPEQAFSQQITI